MSTRQEMLTTLRENIDDLDTRRVVSDWLEDNSRGVFVCIQLGVYRHWIVGVFTRLDKALEASEKAILDEYDHYHNIEIIEMSLDDASDKNERHFCEMKWQTKQAYGPNGEYAGADSRVVYEWKVGALS